MNGTALAYALGAMVTWGLWGILANHSLTTRRPTSVLFVTYLVAFGCMVVFDSRIGAHFSTEGLPAAIGAGLMLALGSLFFYRALIIGRLSVIPAIAGLYFLVSTLYGAFVLGEKLTTVNIAGILLACVAIFLLSR